MYMADGGWRMADDEWAGDKLSAVETAVPGQAAKRFGLCSVGSIAIGRGRPHKGPVDLFG